MKSPDETAAAGPLRGDGSKGTREALQSIYLVIVGLAIVQALTRVFTRSGDVFVGTDIFEQPGWLLLIAFLATVVRFAHGSILHFASLDNTRTWRVSMLGLLAQALVFFVAAFSVETITGFLIALMAIFVVDSAWLLAIRWLHGKEEVPAFRQWLLSNLILIVLLGAALGLQQGLEPWWETQLAIGVMVSAVAATVVDYVMNDDLYFPGTRTKGRHH